MKANELRIGNLIELPSFNGTGENIVADLNYHIFICDVNCIRDSEHYGKDWAGRPIPLTEEWLEKLGFKKGFKDNWYHKESNEYFNFLRPLSKCSTCHVESGNFDDIDGIPIKYVHQLQNLYFALTGEELTIK